MTSYSHFSCEYFAEVVNCGFHICCCLSRDILGQWKAFRINSGELWYRVVSCQKDVLVVASCIIYWDGSYWVYEVHCWMNGKPSALAIFSFCKCLSQYDQDEEYPWGCSFLYCDKKKMKISLSFCLFKSGTGLGKVHPPFCIHCHDGPHADCKSSHAISPLYY